MDHNQASVAARVAELLADLPPERHHLLPALWRVFDEYWRIGPEMIQAIADTLEIPYAEVYGVASFYALFDNPSGRRPLYVCTDVMCALQGADNLVRAGDALAESRAVVVREAPCLGHCDGAPAVFDGHRTIRYATEKSLAQAIRGEHHA